MMTDKGIKREQVEQAALAMLSKGIRPSVRNVLSVTGGKTEKVSEFLRDFNDKRNAEIMRIADEVGSSKIAQLLADEMQTVVERRTTNLQQIIAEQKEIIDEHVALLGEKQKECDLQVEMLEAKLFQLVNEANEKTTNALNRVDIAEKKLADTISDSEDNKRKNDQIIADHSSKCDLLVTNAKSEANGLVEAANRRANKAEQECESLREQVKLLSIEQAKRELEQEQYKKEQSNHIETQKKLNSEREIIVKLTEQNKVLSDSHEQREIEKKQYLTVLTQLAGERTLVVRLKTNEENHKAEIMRLGGELVEARSDK
ncbi:DNA-binding protein (plasmid) [Vibrio sp. SS-MA-C1-2]|uniref:DNA-binding protein n=1 Tax=Vibrio sp. SS-MA-C1-2 TaxID=2908646 RepID=UPI001F3C61B2|nr:DNA-binding protein [Vibrio sp. SS-MA-C1-2]UJF20243.1 DNA-binding protein [Vibrio sp. SS-MA-C1-2]